MALRLWLFVRNPENKGKVFISILAGFVLFPLVNWILDYIIKECFYD